MSIAFFKCPNTWKEMKRNWKKRSPSWQFFVTFLGMVKWPFTRLSDLKLKNQNEMHEFTKKMSYRFGDWTSATLGCPSYRIVEVSKICSSLPTLGKWSNLTFAYVSNWVRSTATRYINSWCQFPSCLPFGALLPRFVLSTEDPPSGRSSLVAEAGSRMQVAHPSIMGIYLPWNLHHPQKWWFPIAFSLSMQGSIFRGYVSFREGSLGSGGFGKCVFLCMFPLKVPFAT